jgi:tRNA U34 5-methylaminomethyl-2-thiouridine-forming methyltransferase MnmC
LNIIRNFGNAIEKNYWIRKLSQKLDVSENVLVDILKKTETRDVRQPEENLKKEKVSKKRIEVLLEKIAGLMLNSKILWEKISNNTQEKYYFSENKKFLPIFEKGREVGYKFENLISSLENKEECDFLQKVYFDTKYSNTENGPMENDLSDSEEQVEYCFNELKKEIGKDRLGVLLNDIRKAEENGDKEGKNLLINEFNKLSQEIK